MSSFQTGLVLATIVITACSTTATDIGPEGALSVVRETLKTEGEDPAEYGTKVEEGTAMGNRCYVVSVWRRVADNPGWKQFFIDPETARVVGEAYVD